MSTLRHNQRALLDGVYDAWNRGAKGVIAVMGTGGGKTVTMATAVKELTGFGVIEAHRAELVGQISLALAREGIRHNITAAQKTVKAIVASHMDECGVNYYDPRAAWDVQSVDTIIRRQQPNANRVNWVFTDECHHVLLDNKWGRAAMAYPNARYMGVTATPSRADGKGLGSHAQGIADAMVMGPGIGELIAEGYLVNYKVYAPQVADLDLSDVHVGASGEFNQQEVARAIKRSNKIVGDVVEHYSAIARGKLGITFAVDIEHAQTLTHAFIAAGIPAALVTADTDEADRRTIMKRFKARELWQLVNVDLFGEGVDVPGVEVVSMARPTASFSLYAQQIGRMLRLLITPELMAMWESLSVADRLQCIAASSKPHGILLDHVGNVRREYNVGGLKYSGLPEGFKAWTLDARAKRSKGPADDAIPLRKCLGCFKDYERIYDSCPYCGTLAPEPTERGKPEFVDGNIYELDPAELMRMRGEIARIDGRVYVPAGAAQHAGSIARNHHERQAAQHHLREAIALWAGKHSGDNDTVNYRRFFHTFGIDVANALTLGAGDAAKLRERVQAKVMTQ